jgi:hypothetical protein
MTRARLTAALCAAALPLVACGGDEGENEKRYDGELKEVAAVVDAFQVASREGDARRICEQLFSDELAQTVTSQGGSCVGRVRRTVVDKEAELRLESLRKDGERQAVGRLVDQKGRRSVLYFARTRDDAWVITNIAR